MLGILIVLSWTLPPMTRQLADYLRGFLELPHMYTIDEDNAQALLLGVFGQVGMIAGLTFLLLVGAAIAGIMVQTGFFFSLELLKFDLMRLMPSKGFKRLFSVQSLVEFGKSFGKLVFLGAVAYSVMLPIATESPSFTGFPLDSILAFLLKNTEHLIIMLVLVFTVIAVGDLFFVRYQYIKNLRMTKAEVKDEFKQMEGDPLIKGRLRQMRVDKARKRMMAQVPKADVVITNPSHYAVALQYDGNKMAAPIVLAKGINLIAQRIREVAEEHHIPIISNPPLARALHDTVEVDQQIPAQHYRAVAEIISYVYKLRKRLF